MIRVHQAHLYVAAATHPGMRGKNNEDSFGVSAFQLAPDNPTCSVLAVLADGIGGHRAGEVASEMAVETVSQMVAQSDANQPTHSLYNAITAASHIIHDQALREPSRRGMGATCVCAWVIGDRLYTASVGDSRLYLVRDNTIRQLTIDHTWVQEAIDYGSLTPEQAVRHPNAHVIRRYLGSTSPAQPDFRLRFDPDETNTQSESNQGMRLLPRDFLLLCSDGLTDLVKKEEILAGLRTYPLAEALKWLINLANARGGHDNITIIALEAPPRWGQVPCDPAEAENEIAHAKTNHRLGRILALAGLGLLALAALGFGLYLLLR